MGEYHEYDHGDVKLWVPPGAEKARGLTDAESKKLDQHNQHMAEKAQHRQPQCWMHTATGCSRMAKVWVQEVQFDFKEDKADPVFAQISSANKQGPVPGFCDGCIHHAALLAERVYFTNSAVYWGMRPRRWFVHFTDGSIQGGLVEQLDPTPQLPTIKTEIHE